MSILCLTPRRTQPSFALQIQLFQPIQASRLPFGGDKSSKMLGGDKSSKGWRKGRRKKNFSRGEKFFKVFFVFWLGPNGKWKNKLFRLRKFYFLSPAFNVPDQKKLFFSKQGSAFPLENGKQQPQAWPTATGK